MDKFNIYGRFSTMGKSSWCCVLWLLGNKVHFLGVIVYSCCEISDNLIYGHSTLLYNDKWIKKRWKIDVVSRMITDSGREQ